MIDIREIYRAPNGTRERLDLDLEPEDFETLALDEPIHLKLALLRVEEGVMLFIEELNAVTHADCVRCNKKLSLPINVTEGEWLYYDKKPLEYDDENEMLFIDKERYEIDVHEPIRQEILLNMPTHPHCPNDCAHFEEASEGVKALSGLKDLLDQQ